MLALPQSNPVGRLAPLAAMLGAIAAMIATGATSLAGLAEVQQSGWTLSTAPLPAVAIVAAAAAARDAESHPLQSLAWSAFVATAVLGAWSVPGLSDPTVHVLAILLGAGAIAIKTAAVSVALSYVPSAPRGRRLALLGSLTVAIISLSIRP